MTTPAATPPPAETTASAVRRRRLWAARFTAGFALLMIAWACVAQRLPGGYTGWVVITAIIILIFGGYWALTRCHPRRPRRFWLGTAVTALVLGWLGSGCNFAPHYELAHRIPDVPTGWTLERTTHRLSDYMDGNGPEAHVATYTVPESAKAETKTYVAALRADGWVEVGPDDYRGLCGPPGLFGNGGCVVLT